MSSTRIERRKNQGRPQQSMGLPERIGLFVGAIHRERADELLAGLASPLQARALAFVQDMKQWDSARRQARLAHEFGVRHDAEERIQALVARTGGALREAIVASLPPMVRAQFPQFKGGAETFPIAVRAIAARLVKEASR